MLRSAANEKKKEHQKQRKRKRRAGTVDIRRQGRNVRREGISKFKGSVYLTSPAKTETEGKQGKAGASKRRAKTRMRRGEI